MKMKWYRLYGESDEQIDGNVTKYSATKFKNLV